MGVLVKSLSPTAVILVRDPIDVSHLNSILMLVNWVGERLTLEVVLRYWSFKWIKIPSFGCKGPLWCFLRKNGQLRWTGTVFSLFSGKLGLLRLRDCQGSYIGRKLNSIEFCGGTYSEVWQGISRARIAVALDQINL